MLTRKQFILSLVFAALTPMLLISKSITDKATALITYAGDFWFLIQASLFSPLRSKPYFYV